MTIPAFCPNCRSIFPVRGIEIRKGVRVGFWNSKTNCPVCGFEEAAISNGVYGVIDTAVEVLHGSGQTRAMAEALKLLAEQIIAGQISNNDAVKKAEEISPRYASLLDSFSKFGLSGLALLVAIITMYLQFEGNRSSSEDEKKIVNAIVEQTFVLKDINDKQRIDTKGAAPPDKKSEGKSATANDPSHRRTKVNKDRRDDLKDRRREFGQSRRR
jgi:hypothetical protein